MPFLVPTLAFISVFILSFSYSFLHINTTDVLLCSVCVCVCETLVEESVFSPSPHCVDRICQLGL